MNSQRILFARELATRDVIDIPSVRHMARFLSLPGPEIGAIRVDKLLRRAWLDSNKEISCIWKKTQNAPSGVPIVTHGALHLMDLELLSELPSALADLKNKGYYKFKSHLPKTLVDNVTDIIYKEALAPEMPGQKIDYNNVLTRDECLNESGFARYFYPDRMLYGENLISKICQLKSLHALGSLYLDTISPSIRRMGWLSVGRDRLTKQQQSDAAQEYHFDYDAFNFLKIFIYLSDVDVSSGAHQYVSGSHLPFSLDADSLKNVPEFFRVTSDQLKHMYPNNSDFISHYGERGSIIAEDTSGFHRGSPLAPGKSRDILVLEYLDSNFNNLFYGAYKQ